MFPLFRYIYFLKHGRMHALQSITKLAQGKGEFSGDRQKTFSRSQHFFIYYHVINHYGEYRLEYKNVYERRTW